MSPVTIINRISIKPGKIEEFIDTQRQFSAALPARGLVGGRMYRSLDGQSAVLVSTFQSKQAQEEILQSAEFKAHLQRLQPLVESSNPVFYEVAYTSGDF